RPLALTTKDGPGSPLVLWDLNKEEPLREFAIPPKITGKWERLVLSANGSKVAASAALAGEKNLLIAWDAASGKVIRQLEKQKITSLELSPDGTELAAADTDGTVEIWSLDNEELPIK